MKHFRLFFAFLLLMATRLQVRTIAGRDWQAGVMANTASNGSGAYHPANYMAITANDDDPDEDNTVLTGEITSGTLVRAQGVYAHTGGATSYTLTRTLTADQAITVRKIGVFTAVYPGGTMFVESRLNAVAVMEDGDQVQITHTVFL